MARYLQQLDTADRHEPSNALAARTTRLKEKIARLEQEMQRLAELEAQMLAYNLTRVLNFLGVPPLMAALKGQGFARVITPVTRQTLASEAVGASFPR